MEKVLLISYSFPPSNAPAAQRTFYFAKYLPQYFVEPHILTTSKNISSLGYGNSMDTAGMNIVDTANASTIDLSQPQDLVQRKTSKNIISNPWLKKVLPHLLFPDRGIIWLPAALKFGAKFLKENKDVKIIYATAPSFTNFLIGLILAKRFDKKLITDFRDFYVVNGLFRRIFPLRLLDIFLEKWIMKKSTALLFISENMKSEYGKNYNFIQSKSHLVYNGFDENDFSHLTKSTTSSNDKLKIFFAGSLYADSKYPRNIFQLLNILQSLIESKKIDANKVTIKMAAHINATILQKLEQHSLYKNIELLGVIKREEVLIEMQNANLYWHILGNSKQDMGAIPIKTFEYIASENPTLFFVPKGTELESIANKYEVGYVCYLDDELFQYNCDVVAKAYQEIVIDNKQFQFEKSKFEKFTRKFQAQQLAEIINSIKS